MIRGWYAMVEWPELNMMTWHKYDSRMVCDGGIPRTVIYTLLTTLEKKRLRKHSCKTTKCWLPAFAPFPTIISTLAQTNFNFSVTFILSSPNAFNFDKFKKLSLG